MDDKTFFDKACNFLLPLAWGFLLLICVFIFFSTRSNAASDQDYFPMSQNKNNHFSSSVISSIESEFNTTDNFIYCKYGGRQNQYNFVYVAYYSRNIQDTALFGEIYNDLIHFNIYKYGSGIVNYRLVYVDDNGYIGGIYNSDISALQNSTSSNYSPDTDYISNYQIYTNNTSTKKIVLLYSSGSDIIPDDDTVPEDFDKPLIDDYLPTDTTPPAFDNSSVESALGSIFDYLQYQTNKISGSLFGVGEYLSDSIMWGLQRVINNIRSQIVDMTNAIGDKIDEVITGIGSSLDLIKDSIDYIIEPFDSSTIQTAFVDTDFGSIITDITSLSTAFDNAFDFNEPDSFDIIIHVENISILNQSSAYTLHLGPHFLPFRTALRTFLWCLVSVGIVFYVEKQLANALRGEVNK